LSEDVLEDDPKVIAATFAEPYIVLLRDDSSVIILNLDDDGELQDLAVFGSISRTRYCSAALYDDTNDIFQLSRDDVDEPTSVLLFLVDVDGCLCVSTFFLPLRLILMFIRSIISLV
jgi:cleavage and polyadenylation specificity factor subunit 1